MWFPNFIAYEECGKSQHPSGTSRIVGGDRARSGDWPWQAALYDAHTNEVRIPMIIFSKHFQPVLSFRIKSEQLDIETRNNGNWLREF